MYAPPSMQNKTKPRQEPNETKQEEAKTGGEELISLSLRKNVET